MSDWSKTLNKAEVNHLRRLVAWVRTEIGPTPEELKATLQSFNIPAEEVSDEARQRLMDSHMKAESIPKYVRQAVRMLEKALKDTQGETVDGDYIDGEASLEGPSGGAQRRLEHE